VTFDDFQLCDQGASESKEGEGEEPEEGVAAGSLVNNLVLKHFLEGVLLKEVKGLPVETLQNAQVLS